MSRNRFEVNVTFDPARGGYVGTARGLPPVVALSLSHLRRKVEALLSLDAVEVRLVLDKRARQERDQRRRGGASRASDAWPR